MKQSHAAVRSAFFFLVYLFCTGTCECAYAAIASSHSKTRITAQASPSTSSSSKVYSGTPYDIEFIPKSTNATFTSTTATGTNVVFNIRVASEYLSAIVDPIKILDFASCGMKRFGANIISARVLEDEKIPDEHNSAFVIVPIAVDVNTSSIAQYENDPEYPQFFANNANDNISSIKFCVKLELGSVEVYNNGIAVSSAVSYTKVKFIIDINMEKTFGDAEFTVTEGAPINVVHNSRADYECK